MADITIKEGAGSQEKRQTVATESVAYEDMKGHWDLIHDLQGGTRAMRDASTTWLPMETAETPDAYQVRLDRSFLHPAYANTIQTIGSKPFVRPVSIQGQVPSQLDYLEADVNGAGQNLSQFAREVFDSLLNYGMTHIFVDYSKVDDPEKTTKADEAEMGARVRFLNIKPPQLIAFLTAEDKGGAPLLEQIRYTETRVVRNGEYADKKVNSIRVYGLRTWELWEEKVSENKKDTEYRMIAEGPHTFGRIPLATCYINQTGFMTALPTMEDLAWLNLAHWQSMSDQRNLLRYARIAILFGSGFTAEEIESGITVGADRLVGSVNPDAQLRYVEHSGSAIGSGEKDIEKLEERMEILGLQPFIRSTGDVTATGRAIDEGKRISDVQAWIRSLENVLVEAYKLAAEWLKVKLPEDFKIDVFNDFGLTVKASTDIDALIRTRQAGEISRETFLREVKRRGLLSETVDVEEEAEIIEAEGPALAEMTAGGGEGGEEGGEE
jgi:hypothetical protein